MKFLITFLSIFIGLSLSAQAPWLRSKAGFLAQLSYHYIPTYTTVFGSESASSPELYYALQERTLNFYGEYGLNKKSTLLFSLPLRGIKTGKENLGGQVVTSGSKWALGNTTIGLRREILSGRIKLSGQILFEVPSPSNLNEAGLLTGYKAWTLRPSIAIGRGYRKAYWQGHIGGGWRSEGYSLFSTIGAESGLKYQNWWFIAFTDALFSFENGDIQLNTKQQATFLYVNDQSYLALGGKIIFEPSRFVGIVGSYTTAAIAQYLPKSPNLALGVYFKWQ